MSTGPKVGLNPTSHEIATRAETKSRLPPPPQSRPGAPETAPLSLTSRHQSLQPEAGVSRDRAVDGRSSAPAGRPSQAKAL